MAGCLWAAALTRTLYPVVASSGHIAVTADTATDPTHVASSRKCRCRTPR